MPGFPCDAPLGTPGLTKGVDADQGQGKVEHQRPCADSGRRNDDPLAAKVVASGDKGGLTKEAWDEQPASPQRCSAHSSAAEQHFVVSPPLNMGQSPAVHGGWSFQGCSRPAATAA